MDQGFRIFQRPPKKDAVHTEGKELDDLDKKVEKLFSGQDLLFERLHTEPKLRSRLQNVAKDATHATARYVKKQPALVKVIAVTVLAFGSGGIFYLSQDRPPANQAVSEVAGISDSSTDPNETITEQPSFGVLKPGAKNFGDLGGRERLSPGGEKLYSYADYVDGTRIEVTQQSLPDSFGTDRDKKLQDLAAGFNAANVIQVDELKVYHGYSDKTKYQTLIFSKDDLLVFILSPQKLSDEAWAGYILTLR